MKPILTAHLGLLTMMFVCATPAAADQMYLGQGHHVRVETGVPVEVDDAFGIGAFLGVSARGKVSDEFGVIADMPLFSRFDVPRVDPGNLLLGIELLPKDWQERLDHAGVKLIAVVPTLWPADAAGRPAQLASASLALTSVGLVDAARFQPGVSGGGAELFVDADGPIPDIGIEALYRFRMGSTLLVPVAEGGAFSLPTYMAGRLGLGADLFKFYVGAVAGANLSLNLDEMAGVFGGEGGVDVMAGPARVTMGLHVTRSLASEILPGLIVMPHLEVTVPL